MDMEDEIIQEITHIRNVSARCDNCIQDVEESQAWQDTMGQLKNVTIRAVILAAALTASLVQGQVRMNSGKTFAKQ